MKIKSALLFSAMCLLAFPALAADKTVSLRNANGEELGTVQVQTAASGTLFTVELRGVSEGWHGFHIHGAGDCSASDFSSAASHAAHQGEGHGYLSDKGPHEGDLPNIWVGESGQGKAQFFKEGYGEKHMAGKSGSAFILHEGPDDYKTDPAGGAGGRVACGVISPKQE